MLEEVLRYINNRFDRDGSGKPYGSAEGTFAISGGTFEVEGLEEGQYFWVEGSALNDGLHPYPAEGLSDETFEGRIVFLHVPNAVQAIADEIAGWQQENAAALGGPYQSESFGGYSYSLSSGSVSGNEMPPAAWQARYGARLRPWRKLSRDWV